MRSSVLAAAMVTGCSGATKPMPPFGVAAALNSVQAFALGEEL
jgi:hypothetical protein